MAHYKYPQFLQQEDGAEYDTLHSPSQPAPLSGVYRCTGCGKSITAIRDRQLPPQNHHQHAPGQGPIQWRLVVKSHWVGGD